ncbi:acyl-CoA dehydrogenase family protein [Nocardioides dongkuii]|uniref:acyl-CoA dehydrogenase family protein n=1 Tax=Nocardioides dongkuii TaxID=2760089 RepID=UPI001877B22E|nr:acyl-CoA dehydrogenase family protein [Nocardioides dongkuii]
MELALSEEQEQLAATVRSLLAKQADPRVEQYDAALWRTLCEQIGVAALAVPEDHDGVGATLLETAVVLEELGRALVPSPLLSSLVTTEVLLAAADDEAQARLLPRIAAGEVAAYADLGDGEPAEEAVDVLDGDLATVLVVAAGGDLYEVDPATARRTWTPTMDQTLRLARVSVDLGSATRIGPAGPARERAAIVGAVGVAALQVGTAARGLEMTVAYSKERVQFGRPIGSFQALKHRMADLLVLVEMARSASWAASYAVAADTPGAAQLAHVAASYCTGALEKVAAETVQLHGGIAITWEHDAHLVLKRAHSLGHLFGSAHEHRRLVEL